MLEYVKNEEAAEDSLIVPYCMCEVVLIPPFHTVLHHITKLTILKYVYTYMVVDLIQSTKHRNGHMTTHGVNLPPQIIKPVIYVPITILDFHGYFTQ